MRRGLYVLAGMRWVFLGSFASSLIVWGYVWYWFTYVWDLFDSSTELGSGFVILAVVVLSVGPWLGIRAAKAKGEIDKVWVTALTVLVGLLSGYLVSVVAALIVEATV